MNYPSIRIEGAILSPDILGQIEELPGQRPSDFALDSGTKVKDEIARAWADAQDYWRIFQRKLEAVKEGSNATTETRNLWMVPLLGLLRYDIEYQPRGTELDGRIYAISHRATNRADAPVQIIGYRDPAGLDRKPANATRRMSAHALVQEFLNLHDQIYGLVTDGHLLRLLRDSSRLVKQSYLEFDLDRIFSDGLFADFAVLYRLLHATRLPLTNDTAAESLIERYHQDSLDSGARIREGLSNAVEQAILDFGGGFLSHPDNDALRAAVANGELSASDYYQQLLRLIYRLLFLMVIEERDLVFPPDAPRGQRDIHRKFYSVARMRRLSEKRYLADPRRHDLWLALQACFRLFEADGPGAKLGIAPLAGDLFSAEAVGSLAGCTLGNDVLLGCLRSLGLYRHPDSGQLIRVNYAALNVEEFGSVYEGLLEYEPEFTGKGRELQFGFRRGDERAVTGSHYTPDDLVQPLIRHSLDHLIAERLKADEPEAALLDLRVADIACGSGHILLAAARRIATELAVVRTGEEQPSPTAYRAALRDAIRHCIYGVDLNPLAVELCKVALWLEAHVPGQPLNFLDHHIKCGNAIVGFARREELGQGVPTEAFKTLPGEDKEVAAAYRRKNKEDLGHQKQASLDFTPELRGHLKALLEEWRSLSGLPEKTPAQIDAKKERFAAFVEGEHAGLLRTIADIPVAQFYIPKVPGNEAELVTDGEFREYWRGQQAPQGRGADAARALGEEKHFFHWFLEFPEIMERGGFDCILGNPPYLGGRNIVLNHGFPFSAYNKWAFPTAKGNCDLVVSFLLRAVEIVAQDGFVSFLTTSSVAEGDSRRGGIGYLVSAGIEIAHAIRSQSWPGRAAVNVSIFSLKKGALPRSPVLNGREVGQINSFFESDAKEGDAKKLRSNIGVAFKGSEPSQGFMLSPKDAEAMISESRRNADVLKPYLNCDDFTSDSELRPSRFVIDFGEWTEDRAKQYSLPYARALEQVRGAWEENTDHSQSANWWWHRRRGTKLYSALDSQGAGFAVGYTSKYGKFAHVNPGVVFSNSVVVVCDKRFEVYAVLDSSIHECWAWKFGSKMEGARLRYTPSSCFDTFPFPRDFGEWTDSKVAAVGVGYYEHRTSLMRRFDLGLTDLYNLFHSRELSPQNVAAVAKLDGDAGAAGFEALRELRRLHVALDLAVRDAYGWQGLDLEHDFHEVETLPENDRVRYSISPAARREVLKRLLAENHARAEAEAKNPAPRSTRGGRKSKAADDGPDLFGGVS